MRPKRAIWLLSIIMVCFSPFAGCQGLGPKGPYIKFTYNQNGEYHRVATGETSDSAYIISPDISTWGDSSTVAKFDGAELVLDNSDGREATISGSVFVNQAKPSDFLFRMMVRCDGVYDYPSIDFSIGVDVVYQDDSFERFSLDLPRGNYPYGQVSLPVPTGNRKPVKFIYPRIVFAVVGRARFKNGELIDLATKNYQTEESFSQPECIYQPVKVTMDDIGRVNGMQDIIFQYSDVANVYNTDSVAKSIAELKRSNIVICAEPGGMSEDEKQVTESLKSTVKIFGYLPLDVTPPTTSGYRTAIIDRIAAAGWHGVFIDCFGYGPNANRAAQNELVDYIHRKGLKVFANGGSPEDAMGNKSDPVFNPSGAPAHLTVGDWYLMESFFYTTEGNRDAGREMSKSMMARKLAAALGVHIACLSYTRAEAEPNTRRKDNLTSYLLAVLFGFNAWHMAPYPDDFAVQGYLVPSRLDRRERIVAPLTQIGVYRYAAETTRYYIVFDLSSGLVSTQVYDKQRLRRVKPGTDVYTSDDLISWSPGAGKRWVRERKLIYRNKESAGISVE